MWAHRRGSVFRCCRLVSAGSVLVLVIVLSTWYSGHRLPDSRRMLRPPPPCAASAAAPNWTSSADHQCNDVLHNMLRGKWRQRPMTTEEELRMYDFHNKVWQEQFGLPKGLQRADKRCGNVNINEDTPWTRALCDARGDTPCCYHNVCVNRTATQCRACGGGGGGVGARDCHDLRNVIQAEYADWVPEDDACRPTANWTTAEVCALLGGSGGGGGGGVQSTLYFIGDSIIRHIFTAFLLAVNGDESAGAFSDDIPSDLRSTCSGLFMFTEKVCRKWVKRDARACGGAAHLQLHYLFSAESFAEEIRDTILSMAKRPRSLVVLGIGIHDLLDENYIIQHVLEPLLLQMSSLKPHRDDSRGSWPRLLWVSLHTFGMVRTPLTSLQAARAIEFNENIAAFLAPWGVPVMDTSALTDNVMSFDGQHYGLGLNRMKVSVLLHYLDELRRLGEWPLSGC